MNAEQLLANFERITTTPDAIARLREFILELAVRGKLVPQNSSEKPAVEADGAITGTRNYPFEIPSTWCWVRLCALGKLRGGGTPSKSRGEF
jgi:type I restriction enzyme S subunit